MKRFVALLAFLVVALHFASADAATRYNFRRLYTFTGVPSGSSGSSYAYDINELGHVVGYATNPGSGAPQAFFNDGPMIQLQPLHAPASGAPVSYAYGISDTDLVVGYGTSLDGYQATTWQGGNPTPTGLGFLGTPAVSGGPFSYAYGVNDTNGITGYSTIYPNGFLPFLHDGTMNAVSELPNYSVARAIDANGNIAGYGGLPSQAYVRTSDGSVTWLGFLGTYSGSTNSLAYGINDALQVVGCSTSAAGSSQAFIWSASQGMQSLGDLAGGSVLSVAYGINNSGQVVGTSNSSIGKEAFVWDAAQGMVSLNSLVDGAAGWILMEARAINDLGQIVGYGRNPFGGYEAFVLTPAPADTPAIAFLPTSFTFEATAGGANPGNNGLNIFNSQTGTLSWSVSSGASWLSLAPAAGQESGTVILTVDIAGLAAGTYVTNIQIAGNAVNSPQSVPVTLTLSAAPAPPTIGVAPASLAWSAVEGSTTAATQQLTISNTGGSGMFWTAGKDQAWISVTPVSGFVASGAYTYADVNVNPTGKPAGSYAGAVSIAASGATNTPQSVSVGLTILPAITVTYPNGGESLRAAQNVTITWNASAPGQTVAKTDTWYSTNGGTSWTLIKSQTGMAANCAWRVPRLKSTSTNSLVRVQFKNASGAVIAEDRSNAAFTILK